MKDLDESVRYVLPGERYNANQQCEQMFGKGSTVCNTMVSIIIIIA